MDLLFNEPTAFVGKIIATDPTVATGKVLFATPHGSVMELTVEELEEPDLDDFDLLLELEEQAKGEEKLLYGGDAAVEVVLNFLKQKAC